MKLIEGKEKKITNKKIVDNSKKIITPIQNSLFNSNLSRERILKNNLYFNGTVEDSNCNKNNRNELISLLNINNIRNQIRYSKNILNPQINDPQSEYIDDQVNEVKGNDILFKVKIEKELREYRRILIKEEKIYKKIKLAVNGIEESESELKSINT
jgi:hypothetical protein